MPSVGKILGGERRIICKEFRFAAAIAAQRFEQPNGNAGADNAGLTTANVRLGVDAGVSASHFQSDQRKQAHLIAFWKMEYGLADVIEGGDHGVRVSSIGKNVGIF